jgi:hypothetical protein
LTTNIQRGCVEPDSLTTIIQRLCIWCPFRLVATCPSNLMQLSHLPTILGAFVTMTKSGRSRKCLLYKTSWPYPQVSVPHQVVMPEVKMIKGSSQSAPISLYICIHPFCPPFSMTSRLFPLLFQSINRHLGSATCVYLYILHLRQRTCLLKMVWQISPWEGEPKWSKHKDSYLLVSSR